MTPSEQLYHAIRAIGDGDTRDALDIIAEHLFPGGLDEASAIPAQPSEKLNDLAEEQSPHNDAKPAHSSPSPDPMKRELEAAQLCWTAFQELSPDARVRVLTWLAAHVAPTLEESAVPAEPQNIVCEGEAAAQLDPLELAGHTPDTAHAVVRAAGLAAVGYLLPATAELVAESSSVTGGDSESLWSTAWLLHPVSSTQHPVQLVLAVTVNSSDGYRITRVELRTQPM